MPTILTLNSHLGKSGTDHHMHLSPLPAPAEPAVSQCTGGLLLTPSGPTILKLSTLHSPLHGPVPLRSQVKLWDSSYAPRAHRGSSTSPQPCHIGRCHCQGPGGLTTNTLSSDLSVHLAWEPRGQGSARISSASTSARPYPSPGSLYSLPRLTGKGCPSSPSRPLPLYMEVHPGVSSLLPVAPTPL